MKPDVRIRRIYEAPSPDDGRRVLVDRLWPRGVAKEIAHLDAWPKELTPSNDLRTWYHREEGSYEEFRKRYEHELTAPEAAAALEELRAQAHTERMTLLTASRDPERSHATVLRDLLT